MVKIYKPTRAKAAQKIIQTITIDELDEKGVGVSRHSKSVLFAAGALPKEICKVEFSSKKANFHHAKVIEIVEPSAERLTPFCEHYYQCGGCQTQHISSSRLLAYRQEALDYKIAKTLELSDVPWSAPIESSIKAYRRKARLAIDARNVSNIKVGFKSPQTNQVVPIKDCGIMSPALQELMPAISQLIEKLSSPANIGHVSLFEADNVCQAIFRIVKPLSQVDLKTIEEFIEKRGLSGVLQFNSGKLEQLGEDVSPYYFATQEVKLTVGVDDFVQVNQSVNLKMVQQALDWLAVSPNDNLLDLFCGLGNFSLPAAKLCQHVMGIEGVATMVERCKENANLNHLNNTNFLQFDLSDSKAWLSTIDKRVNKVLLDPSRIGALEVVKALPYSQLERVVYVSCNPATFVRDAKLIQEHGMKLEKIGLIDMFPGTSHVEVMGLFVSN